MFKKALIVVAAASVAGTPCSAAGFGVRDDFGVRRSGPAAAAYIAIPFSGPRNGRTQAGLRLQMVHDYRNGAAPNAPVVQTNAFELRLIGDRRPTFYVADMPVTGDEARKRNLAGGGIVSFAILAAAAVGAFVIYKALDEDDDDERICLIPEGCP